MATITFSFETTDAGKTRIRHAIAKTFRGFDTDLNAPAMQTEAMQTQLDAEIKEFVRRWIITSVTAYEYGLNKPGIKAANEADNAQLVLT